MEEKDQARSRVFGALKALIRAVPPPDADAEDSAVIADENIRRDNIATRRQYIAGEQYDVENATPENRAAVHAVSGRLPEHLRKHAYSTQLQESVAFLADQISEEFAVDSKDRTVLDIIETAMAASDQLSGEDEDKGAAWDQVLSDALTTGDVAAQLLWDPVEETVFYEFWPSELVRFDYDSRNRRVLKKVALEQHVWVAGVGGEKTKAVERTEYEMAWRIGPADPSTGEGGLILDCQATVYHDNNREPVARSWLDCPMIPWVLMRAGNGGLREMRGESVITQQGMDAADRYNAVEQVSWLICRYNSHGTLAVVGDGASLKLQMDDQISKDIVDVLTFPGGTSVDAVTLPTDPSMIEHQRKVLLEQIYQTFGLTRVDQETIGGLGGGVSGYALEILNRKTDGTFHRVRRNWGRDMRSLFAATLDMTAYKTVDTFVEIEVPTDFGPYTESVRAYWEANPATQYSDRTVTIRLGSGYVVDHVLVRDDLTAGLISIQEGLRKLGYDDKVIKKIVAEMQEEAEWETAQYEGTFQSSTTAGGIVGSAERTEGQES